MRILGASLVAIILATVVFAAQSQQTAATQKPTFRAGVNFVRVDVYPTAGGKAVADLQQGEFEVLEDGVPQKIESFERIVARAGVPEAERAEPRSLAESNEAAADPRNRLFVLFFDTLHTVGYGGASEGDFPNPRYMSYDPRTSSRALASFLDQLIGADDLIALMRPEMSVDALSFTRRPSSFLEFLMSGGEWQKRFLEGEMDDTERKYDVCYADTPGIAPAMTARRREMLMLDSLESLVLRLEKLREGRKAVLVISEGWTLFTPDRSLARQLRGQTPDLPPVVVNRGKPQLGGDPREGNVSRADCERDRLQLADLNDEQVFMRILDEANRANVTFYPVNPKGLTVNSPLTRRGESLKTLASATDGIAVADTNAFTPGLKRIADDLSAYYLLGYYSTNNKADGKFRKITVRIKRPGVDVRARRGYNAPTEAAAAAVVAAVKTPEEMSRDEALARLTAVRADRPLHIAAGYTPGASSPSTTMWVVGEIDLSASRQMPWSSGADATISVVAPNGQQVATSDAVLAALSPRFFVTLRDTPFGPGEYLVRVRARGKLGQDADTTEVARVVVPEALTSALAATPLFYRRGPFTGPAFQPTADVRFRKAERLRVDVALSQPVESLSARLLDRKGAALVVPAAAELQETNGTRYAVAQVTLAPLAQGDYLIEMSAVTAGKTEKRLIAFRVVP